MIRTAAQILNDVETSTERESLSGRQQQILNYVAVFVGAHGYSPTVREICAAVGLSSWSTGAYQLDELVRKGYLTRQAGRPRTIALVDRDGTT